MTVEDDKEFDIAVEDDMIVEDVKGVRTQVYKLKKRWVETQYGLDIVEKIGAVTTDGQDRPQEPIGLNGVHPIGD